MRWRLHECYVLPCGDARLGQLHRKRHHRHGGSELVDESLCKPPVCLTRRVAAGYLWATRALISWTCERVYSTLIVYLYMPTVSSVLTRSTSRSYSVNNSSIWYCQHGHKCNSTFQPILTITTQNFSRHHVYDQQHLRACRFRHDWWCSFRIRCLIHVGLDRPGPVSRILQPSGREHAGRRKNIYRPVCKARC